jgi:hypothetical protein
LQTLIQVICSPGRSVRDAIADDARLAAHRFEVIRERKAGRSPGWTKLKSRSPGSRGSLNIQWSGATRVLTCRVVSKGTGRPSVVVGDFVSYLLKRHGRRVRVITVLPG